MQSVSESVHRPYEEPRGERSGRIVHYRTGRKKVQNPVSPSIIHVLSGMQRREVERSGFAAEQHRSNDKATVIVREEQKTAPVSAPRRNS